MFIVTIVIVIVVVIMVIILFFVFVMTEATQFLFERFVYGGSRPITVTCGS